MPKINLPAYEDDKCTLFALGRNAMYAACQILKIKSEDEVLTPAFDSDGSLQPFRAIGCRLKFFRSDPYTLQADLDDIKKQITTRTKLIHIINHFGLPQNWNDLLPFRDKSGIPILEDNAYSLFSKINNRPFGTFGDMAVFSLRKDLPLIEGGMLRINSPAYIFRPAKKPTLSFSPIVRYFKDRLDYRMQLPPPALYSDSKRGYPEWAWRDIIGKEFSCDYLRPMSAWAKWQLSEFSHNDFLEIAIKKKNFYLFLSNEISGMKNIKVLWPVLPEGIVPFCFSFLVEANRDFLWERLRRRYSVMVWPTLSKAVLDRLSEFPDVQLLGKRLLQVNLHSSRVMLPDFQRRMQNLVRDIRKLTHGIPLDNRYKSI